MLKKNLKDHSYSKLFIRHKFQKDNVMKKLSHKIKLKKEKRNEKENVMENFSL